MRATLEHTAPRVALVGLLAAGCVAPPAEPGALERRPAAIRDATPLAGFPERVVAGDLDQDGALELVSPPGVRQLRGEDLVLEAPGLPAGMRRPAFADLDADGDLDVVYEEVVGGGVELPRAAIREADGWRVVTSGLGAAGRGSTPRAEYWVDVDGDGDHDLIQRATGFGLQVFLTEAESVASTATAGFDGGVAQRFADLDGDGIVDVLVGTDDGQLVERAGAGDGRFLEVSRLQLQRTATSAAQRLNVLDVGDIDGDGLLEAVALDELFGFPSSQRLFVADRDATGVWTQRAAVSSARNNAPSEGRLFDADRDGDLDFVYEQMRTGSEVRGALVLYNDGTGAFGDPHLVEGDAPAHVVDVDGDFAPDLVHDGRAYPVPIPEPTAEWATDLPFAPEAAAFADADGDGALEVAIAADGQTVRVLRADASATERFASADALAARDLSWGDLDGDGDLDLAVAVEGAPDRVYRNEGAGFALAAELGGADRTRAVAWGDYDLDGDVDLASGGVIGPTRLYTNDDGTLSEAFSSADTENTEALRWLDVDGDGDLDLVEGNNGFNRIFRNTAGTLEIWWVAPRGDLTVSLAVADVDRDGAPELIVGNAGPDRIWSFGDEVVERWVGADEATSRVTALDLDGDGDDDLARSTAAGWRVARAVGGELLEEPRPFGIDALALGEAPSEPRGAGLLVVSPQASGGLRRFGGSAPTGTTRRVDAPPQAELLDLPRQATSARAERIGPTLRYRIRAAQPEAVPVALDYWTGAGAWRRATLGEPTLQAREDGAAVFTVPWDLAADLGQPSVVQLRLAPLAAPRVAGSIPLAPNASLSAPVIVGCRGACCDPSGRPREAGTVCRRRAGSCDVAETCDGTSLECPADARAEAGAVCREAAGPCDLEEVCDGASAACPANAAEADGTSCGDAGMCSPSVCRSGVCVEQAPLACDDDDVCTADTCDPATGCAHERVEGCCRADFECMDGEGGACVQGACVYAPEAGDDDGGCAAAGRGGGSGARWLCLPLLALLGWRRLGRRR